MASRQYRYQQRMIAAGRCSICGELQDPSNKRLCARHLEIHQQGARRRYRAKVGPPKAVHGHLKLTEELAPLLGTMPDKDLAHHLGMCISTIWRHRTDRRIPAYKPS